MEDLLNNPLFAAAYQAMARVKLNPRRHTAADAAAHSEAVSAMAAQLAALNGCSDEDVRLMTNLGRAHDIGKITGTARPERSLSVLSDCHVRDERFLALVKWHDTGLPWYRSMSRGEAPSDKAWQRLANEVDVRLLGLFMVADRVDAPGGWRRNDPTTWFLAQAHDRGLVEHLVLDVPTHPSETSAGAALVARDDEGPAVLVIRTRPEGWELPKGGIAWDELPEEAALRELREETGLRSEVHLGGELAQTDYEVSRGHERWLKRVRYFRATSAGVPTLGALPPGCLDRRWLRPADVAGTPLVHEALRGVLQAALDGESPQ